MKKPRSLEEYIEIGLTLAIAVVLTITFAVVGIPSLLNLAHQTHMHEVCH